MVKILVPTDFSSCSVSAIKQAATLARGADGMLLILHVVEHGSSSLNYDFKSDPDPSRQDVVLLLQSFSKNDPPLRFEERRIEGLPVQTILTTAAAEKVDLIVMGTTGRSGFKRLLMGSVAEEVTRRAPCPVLTLKAQYGDAGGSTGPIETWNKFENPPTFSSPSAAVPPLDFNDNPTLALISRGISARATDIHIDPMLDEYNVRFRVDGKLTTYCKLSSEVGRALITQLKVMANLDFADPVHSKEGRLELPESLSDFEVRITTVPVIGGEAISLRILSRQRLVRSLEELGLTAEAHGKIEQILSHGEGIVLVTGPTGSGKTTTLYSMLHELDDGTRHIVTIEDPVDSDIPTFRQLPVDAKHGTTMTSGLRTLLRLDPDIVLVGEIRDAEAAETAMRAASSGKYVFSSLHTRDIASTITALRDLHIDNRSLAGNLAGIISQRLVRRLCLECRKSSTPTAQQAETFREHSLPVPEQIYFPVGCPRCRGTGYYDRIGLFELVSSNDEIIKAIEKGVGEDELRRLMHEHGICTIAKNAMQRVAEGMISLDDAHALTTIHFRHQPAVPVH